MWLGQRRAAFISLLLGRLPEGRCKAQYSGEVLEPPGPGLGRDLVWDRDRPKLQEIDFGSAAPFVRTQVARARAGGVAWRVPSP